MNTKELSNSEKNQLRFSSEMLIFERKLKKTQKSLSNLISYLDYDLRINLNNEQFTCDYIKQHHINGDFECVYACYKELHKLREILREELKREVLEE